MLPVRDDELKRRNGSSAACEPCRKSKLACDHARPTCARCKKRGKPDQCDYHPAPMNGLKKRKSVQQLETRRLGSDRLDASTPGQTSNELHSPTPPILSRSLGVHKGRDRHHVDTEGEASQPGFLGSTNFFSSLAESHNILNHKDPLPASHDDETAVVVDGLREVPNSIASSDIEAGADVLACFYPLDTIDELVDRSFDHFYGPYAPESILRACWASLREILSSLDSLPNRLDSLKKLSRRIFFNTVPALPLPGQNSMRSYTGSFTGHNIRWESVGIIIAGIGAQLSRVTDAYATRAKLGDRDFQEIARVLADAINRCISFCDGLNLINDMILWMLLDSLILISQLYGDSSYVTWKRLGDLSSEIFALGLHVPPSQHPKYIPRWMAEVRKQVKYSAYHLDLDLSMFMGRPPRLTSRYCNFGDPPLELSNEELALEPTDLEAVINSKLNAQGERYDRILTIRPARCREIFPVLLLREEILELCLGSSRDKASHDYTKDLLNRSRELWVSRKTYLQHDPKAWTEKRPSIESHKRLDVWLEHRYNDFLLQRVLVQRFGDDSEELLIAADELLSNTLLLHGKGSDAYIDWIISLFSLPSAGVLALDLLKQQTQPKYRPPGRAPPRSRVIQNLSVLIVVLKWISREGVGNYSLGRQATSTLERVLERVLNADNIPARVAQTMRQHELATDEGLTQANTDHESIGVGNSNDEITTQQYGIGPRNPVSSSEFGTLGGGFEGLPQLGQLDFDESFWLGLEEHPIFDSHVLNFGGIEEAS